MNECQDTPKGQHCLVCDRPGSWERRPANFDDWYPKPPPPCPDPEPTPVLLQYVIVLLLVAVSVYFFAKLLNLA